MMLTPRSNNEPFQALMQMTDGRRSALPCDFSLNDLSVLSKIIDMVHHMPLRARIGDLLWICNRPKNPEHAKTAIDCYISAGISPTTWLHAGKKEFERAYQLTKLLSDSERLVKIEEYLVEAFNTDTDEFIDIAYSIADLIVEVGALKDFTLDIAERLETLGHKYISADNFQNAIRHFQLSSRMYMKIPNESKYIYTLVKTAECYAQDAEKNFNLGNGAKLISSSLFESAIHAYRKIPKKFREEHSIDQKISMLRYKLNEAGRHTLDEMGTIRTPLEGADEVLAASRCHVSDKISEFEALVYFSGVCNIPDYASLKQTEKENMSQYFLSSLFGSTQYSSDGRVVAKTPSVGFSDDQDSVDVALDDKMVRSFSHEVGLNVQLSIIPALQQILSEHTFSKNFVFEMCDFSPLVPKSNVNLVANAIWLGFELDFSTAIHLIAPQIENIVREQLKKHGAHTTNIDKNGIEHENGLSTLLDMQEAVAVFGQDKLFELKALFANSIGPNLRNEVAHGLLTDSAAYSASPVYAWWMLLRMVIHSIIVSSEESNEADN
ncbi:DUF4209 domain-containing protein [Shewanella baltica]|uniref:DUF4209 domain-containing protein n=3 Tax=Shewanella baltica TaxID=62322 RepID=UPI00217EF4C2|nr:DUF4209 domain-containing protein [Shewanella baltica]MCS6098129.1 DUF4209 domain-containing protein [Shewanella baltica]MCS6229083.1 DUF4209 domain-containing protein [Shewanella baltica]